MGKLPHLVYCWKNHSEFDKNNFAASFLLEIKKELPKMLLVRKNMGICTGSYKINKTVPSFISLVKHDFLKHVFYKQRKSSVRKIRTNSAH
mmetsp:Transcript_26373/g.39093  ORF Transcript_26373/g.39093 Transcript_26373/m.39093 type:complete len:91 (+) Transcript_26373:320-592(+)